MFRFELLRDNIFVKILKNLKTDDDFYLINTLFL